MSESVSEAVAAAAEPIEVVVEPPVTEPVEAVTHEQPEPEPEIKPEPAPKPKRTDRHIAHLTAKAAAESERAGRLEQELAAARALLDAGKPEGEQMPRRQPVDDVEARATQIAEQREFNKRLISIDTAGKKELGVQAWDDAKATLGGLGATDARTTQGSAFLKALAESDNPTRLFAHFADDPDVLMELLAKSPEAMATRMGRMDAELSKPVTRPLSGAPKPPAKVEPSGVLQNYDLHNYPIDMPMSEYVKLIDAQLPPHLGGRRKSA
jgi:hypothetical protein